jgi:hypothetical protein
MRMLAAIGLMLAAGQPVALAASSGGAGTIACQCRADNRFFEQGQVVCLKMPAGMQLVECVRSLNVTTWRKVQDGCDVTPQASSRAVTVPPSS